MFNTLYLCYLNSHSPTVCVYYRIYILENSFNESLRMHINESFRYLLKIIIQIIHSTFWP